MVADEGEAVRRSPRAPRCKSAEAQKRRALGMVWGRARCGWGWIYYKQTRLVEKQRLAACMRASNPWCLRCLWLQGPEDSEVVVGVRRGKGELLPINITRWVRTCEGPAVLTACVHKCPGIPLRSPQLC